MTVLEEEAPANYVPAAAVIRRGLALSGFTGRKGCVGGLSSQEERLAQPCKLLKLGDLSAGEESGILV